MRSAQVASKEYSNGISLQNKMRQSCVYAVEQVLCVSVLQRRQYAEVCVCVLTSTLCTYSLGKGVYLFSVGRGCDESVWGHILKKNIVSGFVDGRRGQGREIIISYIPRPDNTETNVNSFKIVKCLVIFSNTILLLILILMII